MINNNVYYILLTSLFISIHTSEKNNTQSLSTEETTEQHFTTEIRDILDIIAPNEELRKIQNSAALSSLYEKTKAIMETIETPHPSPASDYSSSTSSLEIYTSPNGFTRPPEKDFKNMRRHSI